ncbi:hypothetical protein ABZ135_15605 [Streptomyces sp. NPDC006339]|uniref:hypothetical protein n=1 Tax=Streptomyces sp. NPDC006339 TaxID=3156755 RepID=UPI0033B3A964
MATRSFAANGDSRSLSRLSFWPRVREFAVPATMIETATARRLAGDWAGACAAAGFDVDLDLTSLARARGAELAARVRSDLRHLAPDLLRWHLPRIAPDGLLRPGLTVPLARYGEVRLVVRTAPAWADGGQRLSLALWDGTPTFRPPGRHPHPRPSRRFRLDLHRHLWDARRTNDLRARSGADRDPTWSEPEGLTGLQEREELPGLEGRGGLGDLAALAGPGDLAVLGGPGGPGGLPGLGGASYGSRAAVGRWAEEARIVLRAEGRSHGTVAVRAGARRLVLDVGPDGVRVGAPPVPLPLALPLLPDAATWVPPDLELLRAGAIEPGRLHPLVAAALVPGYAPDAAPPPAPYDPGRPRAVECRGALHRIGLVDGALAPLNHDPAEIRREELLAALSGSPLPCLRAIDEAHRRPDCLAGVRERLDHGDTAGALAVVEGLLGPEAVLRDGALREALEAAARRRTTYGLYRAGLVEPPRAAPGRTRHKDHRPRPRHAYAHPYRPGH